MHTPYIIEKNKDYETSYDIYSKLLSNRIIFLEGEITDKTANIVISEMLYLDSISNEDIYLYINSPGGNVTSGFAIYDTMKYIKSNVITIAIGLCASMAAFILSSGNKRCSLKNAEIMIHQPLGGVEGQATEIQIISNRINKVKDKINMLLAKNTKKSLSKIKRDVERDYYMSADEALNYGLIDKII